MRKDYMSVGAKYTATDAQKKVLDEVIASLKWQRVTKDLRLGAMPGMAIKAAIQQLRIPKVSHIAIGFGDKIRPEGHDGTEWHPAVYGIEGHYSNGAVQVILLDDGVATVPLVALVYPAGEEQPNHPAPRVEKPASDAVTIYCRGEFFGNVQRIEAKACTVEFRRFAQYDRAAFITFTPRGKRSPRQIIARGHDPGVLIVGGWDRVEPDSMTVDEKPRPGDTSGLITSVSRYLSHDSRWQTDFDEKIDPLIASGEIPVVFDFRKGIPPAPVEAAAAPL